MASSLNNLAAVLYRQGKLPEAESSLRELLTTERKLFGDENPALAQSLNTLAAVLRDEGKVAESGSAYREARAIERKLLAGGQKNLATSPNTEAGRVEDRNAIVGPNTAQGIPGWGEVTDPDGDCVVKADGGIITITVPGTVHTLSNFDTKKSAPRVMREVVGDFTVQVKVTGQFDPGGEAAEGVAARGRSSYNGAGILLWDSGNNYIRLERNAWVLDGGRRHSYSPLFEYWKDNKNTTPSAGRQKSFFKGECTYLRMTRHGDNIRAAVSNDGVEWIETDSITTQFPNKVKVGVAALNSSKKPFTVEFSEFKLTGE